MTSPRLVLGALVVAGGLVLGYAGVRVGADAPPPARVARLLDEGRSLAPYVLGVAGMLPFRFVEARCSGDGRTALLFENALALRFYAVVGAQPPPDSIDPVFGIVPLTVADFDQTGFSSQLVSCGPVLRTLAPGEHWLPVATSLFNGTHFCGGGGYSPEPRLRGSADDPRLVWMVDPAGKRLELAWPPGFSVRLTPRLEVLNARGDAVAFDGSRAASGCGTGEGAIYVDFWR